ncbi:Fumarate hydratase class I, anaerobic [Legionella lansingensis]|uniref:Fumarate hydratase class I, anaerobic n=1 Tax=Legionella lansingensis TaxID=45067 RepID=A0A0W0VGT9_9GAMM|nr:Fe-S-containing hydro-lyase [Legionella lansingensis]KTD19351.1 Fumarate hydratase class I, anaerobic [Legionella lansingensis]SNV52973.1 Fumarate hydratase class I, anaerobic [Legionella lansingensis]
MKLKKIKLKTPLDDADIEALKSGDLVSLSGVIYAARDAAHARFKEAIEANKPLPFDPHGQIVYYVGPTPPKPGHPIGSAGPTTASRMDPYAPLLIERGLKGMIGKGRRNNNVLSSMRTHKCVYFGAIEGTAVLISRAIKSAKIIAYEDLGAEAVYEFVVEDFSVVVVNDIYGGDLYQSGKEKFATVNK